MESDLCCARDKRHINGAQKILKSWGLVHILYALIWVTGILSKVINDCNKNLHFNAKSAQEVHEPPEIKARNHK